MSWINLLCLAGGVGVGLAMSRLRRSTSTIAAAPQDALAERVHQSELAYQMAVEMSQFKGGFLSRTSHELRSPLNGIIGIHQLILADLCETPEEEREFIAQAHESTLKMVQLLDEVIEVARTQPGTNRINIQPVQLLEVLQNVENLTHLLAENRNLRLKISLPDPDIYVMADPTWLRHVLTSLVNDAIASMPEGSIHLSVAAVDAEAHILLEDERPAELWREAIDLLQTSTIAEAAPPSLNGANLQPAPVGFHLLLRQTLMESMHGRLELVATPSQPGETLTRIQCSIPAVVLEAE